MCRDDADYAETCSTRFADMPIGERKAWVRFARSHDWGQSARYDDASGEIVGCITYFYALREDGTEYLADSAESFSRPDAMRAWAGY